MIENYEIVDQATMTTALPSTFSSVVKTTLEELSGLTGEADEVLHAPTILTCLYRFFP